MTTTLTQIVYPQALQSVRLTNGLANVVGVYNNGPSNNGRGATLTTASPTLTLDSVAVQDGDSVLLLAQDNNVEQGIYVVSGVGTAVVLTRRTDFHVAAQLSPGLYTRTTAGDSNNGKTLVLLEPVPAVIGFGPIEFSAG